MIDMLWRGGAIAFDKNKHLADCMLAAPHLIEPELLNAARRLAGPKNYGIEDAWQLVIEFDHVRLYRFEHENLRDFAWRVRDNMSAYDAMYVALAKQLEVPLITSDARLAKTAKEWCEVRLLSELLEG
ncbi:type II toxin-antitoxin system VapC family toxin [Diaminobutyricibacter sp. McL0608]|uniref:type II toxin-antitoxin system VapC family toxin n=1 Tax=Leifsonia sp. McL0608 TaxID=3143537 RepID=UPI0031F2F9B7